MQGTRRHLHPVLTLGLAALSCFATPSAWPQQIELSMEPIAISATRSERPSFDTPASVDTLDVNKVGASQLQVNLSESLVRVPGIVAQNRQNYAQDLQISSRGFGARSTFGVRGLRLYVDGIPATMPDGQGQLSHVDLNSAARIEVLRGPYSALYGNSSGGVISVFTQDGSPDTLGELSMARGDKGTYRVGVKASGQQGPLKYTLSANRFETDGYRDHSAAERTNVNGKLKYALNSATRLTLVFNSVRMPGVQDPMGLTRADFEAHPRQAPDVAHAFNTRKSVSQDQLGLTLNHRLSSTDTLQWTAYMGMRETTQFQAIPTGNQLTASSPGGVIDLSRAYWGTEARWVHRARLLGRAAMLTAGLSHDELDEHRRGYLNFIGPADAPTGQGVLGALRRNERNKVRSFDQYLQGEWDLADAWTASAGMRHSRVSFRSHDDYLVNGNDSGRTHYSATTYMLSMLYRVNEDLNLYGTTGRGFETPTLNELAYRSDGAMGLNLGLDAARSRQWEMGLKARLAGNWLSNVAYFEARTADEIVVQTNTGGRTTYQNAGRTRRQGVEASVSGPLGAGFAVYGAATLLDAVYRDAYLTCKAAPCATPTTAISAGHKLPGIPRRSLYAELQWRQPAWGFETALELRHVASVFVDDRNSEAAPAYTVANLRMTWQQQRGRWSVSEFLRIDNLSNRRYAGSVIVNEGNTRYFEAAPERSWLVGVSTTYRF